MHYSYMDICLLILTYWSNTEHRHHAYAKHIQTDGIQDDVLHMQINQETTKGNRKQSRKCSLVMFCPPFWDRHTPCKQTWLLYSFWIKTGIWCPPYTTTSSSGLKQHIYSQSVGWDKYELKKRQVSIKSGYSLWNQCTQHERQGSNKSDDDCIHRNHVLVEKNTSRSSSSLSVW